MSIDIRLPDISGSTEAEQLRQVRSYLYQLAEQLQFALSSADGGGEAPRQTAGGQKEQSLPSFPELKSLIIKSADIVQAYSDEITRRLEGDYVAQSEFGTFMQETAQTMAANSESLRLSYENLQAISRTLDSVRSRLLDVSAYIKTGLLGYGEEGAPVYGVEIGQEDRVDGVLSFRRFARLTAEKLSFFDSADNEVAYIGDRALHITDAQIYRLTAVRAELGGVRLGQYCWYLGSDGHLTLA